MSHSGKERSEKKPKETGEDFEKRIWKERLHVNADGNVFLPRMAIVRSLQRAAQHLGEKIPGKGKKTYKQSFESGLFVAENPVLKIGKTPIKADDIEGEWLFLNSDGKRGGGTRVWRCYPVIPQWETVVEFVLLDESITEDVFKKHLNEAGKLIGVGRFRPENGGFYGRYSGEVVEFSEMER